MKLSTFAAALAASTIAGSAMAADLPSRKMAPAYVAPVPVMTWAGFYVGLNAGATFGGSNTNNIVSTSLLPGNPAAAALAALGTGAFGQNNGGVGFIGGAQIGWNWQSGGFVAGLEADIQGIAGRRNNQNNVTIGAVGGSTIVQVVPTFGQLQWLGTVRGRLGFAVSPTWLLYATGGLAYGGAKASTSIVQFDANNGVPGNAPYGSFGSYSGTKLGWTVGAGGEWKFAQNWSAKLEYLYYDLGSATYSSLLAFTAPPGFNPPGYGSVLSHTTKFNGHIVRAGLNYHFGGGAGPVVAKY